MDAWPLEEALLRPAVALLLAFAVPFTTAALLRWVYLEDLPAGGDERARRLVPFRRAAFFVGLGQLQLAWMAGATALGPALVERAGGWESLLFGALCAVMAFAAGGVARRIEEPEGERSSALGTVLLRLRLVPFFAGPVLAAVAAAELPLVTSAGGIRWGLVALAFVVIVAGVAWGGLLLSVSTGALRPAPRELRALAGEVAGRERTSLLLVLRLPTDGTRFANAAAIPWARTMIVTDRLREMLAPAELRAVLAHEAGHLSEGPRVALARLGAATLVLFALAVGPAVASTLPDTAAYAVLAAAVLAGLGTILSVRRLARRMEERADRRAAETAGAAPLAGALRRLHENGQMPLVTGQRRVHPDLYDRLVALGEEPGARPPPPPRGGTLLGLAAAIALVGLPAIAAALTDVDRGEVRSVGEDAARWRLRLDPWDGEAMIALGWHARQAERHGLARARAEIASRMGPDPQSYHLLWAELHAAEGDCDAARRAFERSLQAQAEQLFDGGVGRELELGHYALPPTLVRSCELTVGDAFGEPGDGELRIDYRGE